jgi:competence protein ComEC
MMRHLERRRVGFEWPLAPETMRRARVLALAVAPLLAGCGPRAAAGLPAPLPERGPWPAVAGGSEVLAPTGRDPAPPSHAARFHFVDVGQGSAVLVELSCAAALIDLGGEKSDAFDGVEHLRAYLEAFFERRADLGRSVALLVLTHPHIDHVRGYKLFVDGDFAAANVVTNGMESGSGGRQQKKLMAWAREHARLAEVRVGALPAHGGLTSDVIDPIRCDDVDPRIEALWGQVETDPGWGDEAFENANNHSVVLRIGVGSGAALFSADLEEPAIEALLARSRAELDVDLWHVGHHGSHNGTTAALLDALTPGAAVISMGAAARETQWSAWQYGHPRASSIDALESHCSYARVPVTVPVADGAKHFASRRVERAIFATGWDGDVVLRLDERGGLVLE